MRPARKARGGRISGIFNRRATQRAGMQRNGYWFSCEGGACRHFCCAYRIPFRKCSLGVVTNSPCTCQKAATRTPGARLFPPDRSGAQVPGSV
jgi:hypothetical protein